MYHPSGPYVSIWRDSETGLIPSTPRFCSHAVWQSSHELNNASQCMHECTHRDTCTNTPVHNCTRTHYIRVHTHTADMHTYTAYACAHIYSMCTCIHMSTSNKLFSRTDGIKITFIETCDRSNADSESS